ncbi:maleylpyruvate isomerase family mycothiol-dependent enzyme [Nocardioides guangzhouensis]|uniref:Maleylpyruvate isomerase family mycothiol-dependent enzyme n=1 Tax=Nocardioides guangzhouensis TaxID=2497878 RepID=A0A4V1XXU7_9ACTN|nr:maleylpyruvate isomerase family mycothiol-dependent enzyme [Nocardioides guangzhouensis]RYP80989.1 maleylpyruvate isomerase family mycothiol-dependent enzyme [Nocardioides guangzhouensis]
MATDLPLAAHLEGVRTALVAFVRYADRAGLRAGVPTCPDWDVRALIAHQGMVHRWATAIVRGERLDPDAVEREGKASPDPVEWLRDGAIDLAQALTDAPEDLKVLRFLNDPPPARQFWARRQCHETTIHAVDALSAALGRYPVAADTWIDRAVALDGIDELLTGFVTRSVSRLRSEDPVSIAVRPTDSDHAWLVEVGREPAVTTRHRGPVSGDVLLEGPAVALYLTLWNRSDEVVPDHGFDVWRDHAQVRWG